MKQRLGANGEGTLIVHGKAVLAGELDVTLADGFVPTPGTKIEILKASAVTGAFEKLTVAGHRASLSYGPTAIVLTIDG
jgi:hypothetical protein